MDDLKKSNKPTMPDVLVGLLLYGELVNSFLVTDF
jgi:hypothetical protein